MSVNAAFNGTGRLWPAMLLSAARVILVFLPLALLGQWLWQLSGIFAATALANIAVGLWAWLWLRRYIAQLRGDGCAQDRKSTRLNSSHVAISYTGLQWKNT